MAEKDRVQKNSTDEEDRAFDDVEAALTGMNMLLNNGFDEARVLFEKYKEESPLMHAGYSFVFFMQALMSFEEEKIGEALRALQETEKYCEVSDSFMKSVKRKFRRKNKSAEVPSTAERLQRQVVVADSLLYQSILIFTNQDIPSYVRGGWLLRKAWKIYDKLHSQVSQLKEKASLRKIASWQGGVVPGSASSTDPNSLSQSSTAPALNRDERVVSLEPVRRASSPPPPPWSAEGNASSPAGADPSEETIGRLLGAISFGYGVFQLCMSMVPPRILKLIEFLGFEGEREVGLACLDCTSHSRDMKAPLATLALLWYHTVLRPFFALDGVGKCSQGTYEAEAIIREKEAVFPNSSLFFFFRGRIHRLRREADKSYEMYMKAYQEAKGQRELELMCLYEISWYNLMKRNWDKGAEGFRRLQRESRWSSIYYSYLIAVCLGSGGKVEEATEVFHSMPAVLKKRNNQIEVFVAHKTERLKKTPLTQEHCQLLVLELIFLWHSLPACSHHDLLQFLQVCEIQTDPSLHHLRCLLQGALYRELDQEDVALQCLKECVALQQGKKDDAHVAAFALFELASIYIKSPLTKSLAREHLQHIKDNYKDYDFENRLSVRVSNSLRQLRQGANSTV